MANKRSTKNKTWWQKYRGLLIILFLTIWIGRIFFGDFFNAIYMETYWRLWVIVFAILNLVFLSSVLAIIYFAFRGILLMKTYRKGPLEISKIVFGLLTLISIGLFFGYSVIKIVKACILPVKSYEGECVVWEEEHRRSSDEYFMKLGNGDVVRIGYYDYRLVYPNGYPNKWATGKCNRSVNITYLQGLAWPVEFRTE